ncbi:MAG: hypothetical protein AB8H79_15645 [Myxococcota bacterium]
MQLIRLSVCLCLLACNPDYGIPDDWLLQPLPQNDLTITSNTCGQEIPVEFNTGFLHILTHDSNPRDPLELKVDFGDDSPQFSCFVDRDQDTAPFTAECRTNDRWWVNQEQIGFCEGKARITPFITADSATRAHTDFTFEVYQCPCDESCDPYPPDCKIAFTVEYGE